MTSASKFINKRIRFKQNLFSGKFCPKWFSLVCGMSIEKIENLNFSFSFGAVLMHFLFVDRSWDSYLMVKLTTRVRMYNANGVYTPFQYVVGNMQWFMFQRYPSKGKFEIKFKLNLQY